MPYVDSNGICIAYVISGPEDGEPLLLIHGVGAQLVRWPEALYGGLASRGFRVIRFDNRDVGLSTHIHEGGVPDLAQMLSAARRGETPSLPYTLKDLAADALGLLDALAIEAAHVVGVSLGGMIVQQMVIDAPARVLSMTIMMSQSGHPEVPAPDPVAVAKLTAPAPDPEKDRDAYLAHSVALNRALGSPLYPTSESELRRFAGLAADRAYDPAGGTRQLAAGRAAPDRSAALARIVTPALVIHGVDDPLMSIAAGEQLAEVIPGAWLLAIKGMAHDIPVQLCELFVGAIASNAARSSLA
jgi:pimeloyl-ACP methyl ester carboxylesterase